MNNFRVDPNAKLKNLSKGGYAKIGLSLALAVDPQVLILDEPTSGLDLLTRREFLNSMVDLAGVGRTILICSHQIAEVERIASHVAIMNEGKLMLVQPIDDLKKQFFRVRLRFQGAPPDPAGLGTVLERHGTGRFWQALIRNPRTAAIESLRLSPNVFERFFRRFPSIHIPNDLFDIGGQRVSICSGVHVPNSKKKTGNGHSSRSRHSVCRAPRVRVMAVEKA